MRADIREGVRRYVNDDIKPNFAALARQYNCDYRTVKAAYEAARHPQPERRRKRKSVFRINRKPIVSSIEPVSQN
ncbi:hypothetical protein [Salinicoccus roseus]|uniref:hypothetical protein n=1 Tax=Salinicoccus roseus TaxID=45670 RepID=UPI002301CAA4|nr:hypothetical protein [Salinicoccus roseus]